MREEIDILGTMKYFCDRCKKHGPVSIFNTQEKKNALCADCLLIRYRIGKPTKDNIFGKADYCEQCNRISMKIDEELTRVTDTHVIKKAECTRCGRTGTIKIAKWRR